LEVLTYPTFSVPCRLAESEVVTFECSIHDGIASEFTLLFDLAHASRQELAHVQDDLRQRSATCVACGSALAAASE
jgi:hypothetical protein